MENKPVLDLDICPMCRGDGMIVHEGGWNVQVECADCGAHTVYVEYDDDVSRTEAEQIVARLWNMGKVVHSERGE